VARAPIQMQTRSVQLLRVSRTSVMWDPATHLGRRKTARRRRSNGRVRRCSAPQPNFWSELISHVLRHPACIHSFTGIRTRSSRFASNDKLL